MSKKKVLSLALAVIMIAILSFSTLAWFNDTDEVTNKFQIATSDDLTPDEIFSVDVWEPVDENNDGVISDDEKKNGQEFKDILPGSVFNKEPTVENTGYYDQYVRVVVKLSDAAAWKQILPTGYDLSKIFVGHDATKWTRAVGTTEGDEIVYVYYLNDVLKAGETAVLFKQVKLPTTLDQEQMATLLGGFELKIRADAVQTENLGEGVDTAQEAFAAVKWANHAFTEPQP